MLRTLSIRDVVIVTSLELDFSHGFNVLSGETGAGKSILLGALSLALGERADASIVREGALRADVCAEFSLTLEDHPDLMQWLEDNAFDAVIEEEPSVITPQKGKQNLPLAQAPSRSLASLMLRRTVDNKGRSKGFINGVPATVAQLREISRWLVDIHGQHAHQLLLQTDFQRQLVDRHAGLSELSQQVGQRYEHLNYINKAVAHATLHAEEQQRDREQLEWHLEELEKLAPQAGEWEQLQSEHARLAHGAQLIDGIQTCLNYLDADDAALPSLHSTHTRLQQLLEIDPTLAEIADLLGSAKVQIEEAVHTLNRYAQHLDLDPERLATVDARLQVLHGTARKYKVTPEKLHEEANERRTALAELKHAQDLDALHSEQRLAYTAYRELAQKLSAERQAAVQQLTPAVTAAMQTLAMAGGYFEIALKPLAKESANGLEQIEFLVAAHPGANAKPLAKVASGGELARISLALSVITSSANPTPTLIFDEVDSGIGGAVAEMVGQRLRQLGTDRQVLCITHLAQVAALAHQQFRVTKQSQAGQTLSHIALLDNAGRIEEIARMLGGKTATAAQHAQQMLLASEALAS